VAGFDRTVADGIHLSNAPDAPDAIRPKRIYGTIFFPWPAPVTLAAGDVITIELEARLIRDEYIWSWKTTVLEQGRPGASKAAFAQSTFLGAPLSPVTLQKQAASYQPTLTEDGQIARSILASMNDGPQWVTLRAASPPNSRGGFAVPRTRCRGSRSYHDSTGERPPGRSQFNDRKEGGMT
jgi:hypothetical protein